MRQSGLAPSLLAILRQLPAMLACLAVLAGCRFGEAVSLFDDAEGIAQAIGALRERIGERVFALKVSITADEILVLAQNPADRNRVNDWRLTRVHVAALNWDRTSGPSAFELRLINPDLEANLFDLREIDFAAAMTLARAAKKYAALAGAAKVTRMEIAREVFIIPRPASGEIRWTAVVGNGQESVQVFADARGAIVGRNIDGTIRAKSLDILRELGLMADAATAFRLVLGQDQILTRVNVGSRAIGFETTLADPAFAIAGTSSVRASRVYTWNLNGLQRAIGVATVDAASPASANAPFSADEVDWTALPRIATAAKERLAMPEGRVSDVTLSKPTNRAGPMMILWKVEVTDKNNDKGFILADTSGAVKDVTPPQSRR